MKKRLAAGAAAVALVATTAVSVAVATPAAANEDPGFCDTVYDYYYRAIFGIRHGDVNRDYAVTAFDAYQANLLVQQGRYDRCADVDGSRTVTSADVSLINQASAGLITLPVG